jgi:hypothetical protein
MGIASATIKSKSKARPIPYAVRLFLERQDRSAVPWGTSLFFAKWHRSVSYVDMVNFACLNAVNPRNPAEDQTVLHAVAESPVALLG